MTKKSEKEIDILRARLKQAGLKLTPQRLEIFKELVRSKEHPDAETVFRGVLDRMPSISLDTVYRTLWLFRDIGIIDSLGSPSGRTRFDANMLPHHHFTCTVCGGTTDFYSREFDMLEMPDCVKELGSAEKAQVEIRGVCRRCAGRRRKTGKKPKP